MLQAAGLSAEEKRDILNTTKNSLDYPVISSALQSLWDDQLLGGHRLSHGPFNAHYLDAPDENYANYQHEYDDWWQDDDSWWYDDSYDDVYAVDQWREDDWHHEGQHAMTPEPEDPEAMAKLQEAQSAERIAESLAAEATRTWTEAQRATQALRRDRGFGSPSNNPAAGKCFLCGGNHFARDCPDRRHPGGKGRGKGYLRNFAADMDDAYAYYFNKGKGKGKSKSKKGMVLEAQAWMKGKKGRMKGSGKDATSGHRSVNAYATDLFLGGLEVSEAMAADDSQATPSTGMIDCGATASAAPEAVVRSLIAAAAAVLTQDKSAKIELEQSARPYFRFGNGRWGRALCRVHLSSFVSGQPLHFSLYALPNPDAYYSNSLDKSSLVPVLIGMDYLGPNGVGMMIDFATGLAMNTKDPKPEVYQLQTNRKGHLVLDIVQYLTQGNVNHEGQAHVVVRAPLKSDNNPAYDQQVLELGTLWLDMTVQDAELDAQELQIARDRMWQLFEASRMSTSSSAFPAQMSGTLGAENPTTTSSTHSNGDVLSGHSHHRPGDRGAAGCSSQGEGRQGQAESSCSVSRHDTPHESRPTGSQDGGGSMAVLRPSHPECTGVERPWGVDHMQRVQRETALHTEEGVTGFFDSSAQCPHRSEDVDGAPWPSGQCQAYGEGLFAHDEQDHGRDGPGEVDQGAPGQSYLGKYGGFSNKHGVGPGGRRGVGGSLREGAEDGMNKDYKGKVFKPQVPMYVGKKIMAMATLFNAMTTTLYSIYTSMIVMDCGKLRVLPTAGFLRRQRR